VTVTNSGTGTLAAPTTSIAYGSGSGWLTATVTGAAAPFTITVQPSVAALSTGQYGATVSVSSVGASNSPRTFTVSLEVGVAHLFVRTASGASMDVTGTEWSDCYAGEPSPGMSRRTTESFGAGTLTFTTVIFTASVVCDGQTDPAQGSTTTGQSSAQGDRQAGWDNGLPPGITTTEVTATAVLLSGWTPAAGMPDPLKTLVFVNDLASPPTVHMGKGGVAPDGYPTTLESWGKGRVTP
jgi:hypothetical protein